jgi:predicted RNA-binding protein with PIN domain
MARGLAWGGVLEALGVVAAFVGFGLACAEGLARAFPSPWIYPRAVVEDRSDAPSIWLLDGFNVLHAGPLGGRDRSEWWTEPRRSELLDLAERFDDPRAEIWVVFDGPRPEAPAEADASARATRPRRVFAPSADEWLLAQVRAAEDPGRVAVVTSDRKIAARARHRGAQVFSPRVFLDRCAGPGTVLPPALSRGVGSKPASG